MSLTINVTPQEMLNIATMLEKKVEDWNRSVNQIYRYHQQMDAMWDGSANDEFNRIFLNDRTKFNRLYREMLDFIKVLRETSRAYTRGENEVKTIVRRV